MIKLALLLIAFGSFQGLFLAIVLWLRKSGLQRPNRIFALLLFLFSLYLGEYVTAVAGLIKYVPHLSFVTFPFLFLIGPLFYFYTQSICKPNWQFQWRHDCWHLSGYVVYVILLIPFYISSADFKKALFTPNSGAIEQMMYLYYIARSEIFLTFTLAYVLLSLRLLQRNTANSSEAQTIRVIWFTKFCKAFAVLLTIGLFTYIIFYTLPLLCSFYLGLIFTILVSFMIQAIAYSIIAQPPLFSDYRPLQFKNKYKTSALTEESKQTLLQKLQTYLVEEKPYLDFDINLERLAEQLAIPKHQLSQIINQELNTNFFDLMNHYRVEEAKKLLLQDPDAKILAVALDAGFNNKVSFYRAFKKLEGISPSEYRKRAFQSS